MEYAAVSVKINEREKAIAAERASKGLRRQETNDLRMPNINTTAGAYKKPLYSSFVIDDISFPLFICRCLCIGMIGLFSEYHISIPQMSRGFIAVRRLNQCPVYP